MDIQRYLRVLKRGKKGETLKEIPIEQIHVSALNVRKVVLNTEELAGQIEKYGLQQAITLRSMKEFEIKDGRSVNGRFEVIFGQRRFLAMSEELGWKYLKVPEHAIVKEMDDKTALELSFIENISQEGMDPLEKALAIKQMLADDGYKLELDTRYENKIAWKAGIGEALERLNIEFFHIVCYLIIYM